MHQLVTKYTELDKYFCNGGFSTQLSNANQQTINKDIQTAGGTKEFSLKARTVAKYYITSEYWSICQYVLI